jgi:UDP-N-acetylmuramoyl-L-alanyl-D-glutamate--2,6-diaminopimelate ligase
LRPQRVPARSLTEIAALLGVTVDDGEQAVTGVTHDSRHVRPGDLFAALPGTETHGSRFVDQALTAGAVAVLTDPAGAAAVSGVPVLAVPDPRRRLGEVAALVYGEPANDLLMLGVTGTNGKTTTAYLVESGLRAAGHRAGLIGTVETRVGDEAVTSVRTTPEATDLHALLAVMRERGLTACVMEVSSHALVFGRVDGVVFDVAGFTNLSQDHLDFHTDLDDYFAAKSSLFTTERARRGTVCVDDAYGRLLAAKSGVPVATVSIHGEPADWRVSGVEVAASGGFARAVLAGQDGVELSIGTSLPGDFNLANAALAVVMLLQAGVPAGDAVRGVAACAGVPGRMERVQSTGADEPLGVVDYAHTPDALETVLRALRPFTRGRLIAIVGAGGKRDPHKRPRMGSVAVREADLVIVTDDNPRTEDPAAIRAAVLGGAAGVPVEERAEVREIGDRAEAIRAAVDEANGAADTVVVLGKGHEQGQEVAGDVLPFDDRAVLRAAIERWNDRRAAESGR